jgi:hypothetical protein
MNNHVNNKERKNHNISKTIIDKKTENIHRHRYNSHFTSKNNDDIECNKIFKSIAIKKKEYEDRRLSHSNDAKQNRINRLLKSLKTF